VLRLSPGPVVPCSGPGRRRPRRDEPGAERSWAAVVVGGGGRAERALPRPGGALAL